MSQLPLSTVLGALLAALLAQPLVQDRPASEEAAVASPRQEAPVPERPAGTHESPPTARTTVTLPGGSREVSVSWRQIGRDLAPFLEPRGADEASMRQLRIQSVLRVRGRLKVEAPFSIDGRPFAAGSYELAFTVSAGEALRFFLVDGAEAVPLSGQSYDPAWSSPVMLFQLAAVDRGDVRLLYHHGDRAGAFALRLGAPVQQR